MPLDISRIIPQKGKMYCILWENDTIGLPLQLFYFIEIPLEEFDTGHTYVEQPSKTSFAIDFIRFIDKDDQQIKNWKDLNQKNFLLTYENGNAEGSIYLGSEHCQFNSQLSFLSLYKNIFEIEMIMNIDFNIETINLKKDGAIKIKTELEFEGLKLYPPTMLPSFENGDDPFSILKKHIDLSVYENVLMPYMVHDSDWKQLSPIY